VDFIEDSVNGYIVDPVDIDGVVAKVAEMLKWDAPRRTIATNTCRESVRKANYPDAAKAFIDACRHAAAQ
jgi:hypothetical protein